MKVRLLQGGINRIMLAGVPRNIAIIEGGLLASLIFGIQSLLAVLIGVPVVVIIHLILVYLYKKDEYFLEVLIGHIKEDEYLDV